MKRLFIALGITGVFLLSIPAMAQEVTPFVVDTGVILEPLTSNVNTWLPIMAGIVAIGGGIMLAFILSDAVKDLIVNALRSLRGS